MLVALHAANQSSAFALQSHLAGESLAAGRTALDAERADAARASEALIEQVDSFRRSLAELFEAAQVASSENADRNEQSEYTSAGGRGGRPIHRGDRYVRGIPIATATIVAMPVEGAPPQGWLRCDGTERDIKTYEPLFEKIGNRFGAPTLSNSFRIPGPLPLDASLVNAGYDWFIRT